MGVWVDTDMGFDDLVSIFVLEHMNERVEGMSLVFGNAPLAQVARNVAGAREAFGWHMPVYMGAARPILGQAPSAVDVLGETGLQSAGLSLPQAELAHNGPAVQALANWLEQSQRPECVLALGPLTNIATLALSRPDLIDRIGTLTWMGGSVTGGNHTTSAEFNAAADPEAVAIVLEHGLPLRMVDLDFCRGVTVTPEDIAPIRAAGGRNAEMLADLLAGYVEIGTSRGRSGSALYDPVAAFALARSGSIIFHPAQITVELAGTHTRGRTVVETRPHRAVFNAEFAADGDLVEARQAILDVLQAEAAK